jgi:hypothetical protein
MKKMKKLILISCLLAATAAFAQQFSIDWYKVAGGGGTASGSTYSMNGTIGQHDAGTAMKGNSYSVTGGFWSIIAVVPGVPNLIIQSLSPGSVKVSWPNTGSYTLQQNSNLVTGTWTASGYTITTANGTNSITIAPPVGNLFFRLSNP